MFEVFLTSESESEYNVPRLLARPRDVDASWWNSIPDEIKFVSGGALLLFLLLAFYFGYKRGHSAGEEYGREKGWYEGYKNGLKTMKRM